LNKAERDFYAPETIFRVSPVQPSGVSNRMGRLSDNLKYNRLCMPELLAALGPLLCLYRADDSHALCGWSGAKSVQACIKIDSDGPREALTFFDAGHRACWQLYLLPDSDYLSWDRLLSCVRCELDTTQSSWLKKMDPAPISRAIGNQIWRACALRFYAVSKLNNECCLALAEVSLSNAGRRAAQAIAKTEGATQEIISG